MTRPKAIGIDLGTTNSCAAWVDEAGHSSMIPNAEGDSLTPSVVLFDDSEVVVGKEARNACIVEPSRVAIWVKRDMGAPVYSRPIRGEYLPPEVIQACILRKLRNDVAHVLVGNSHAVITVPAYFDEPRRKATADAGEMAGLRVLDIVNEPTAGALAFAETLGYLSPDSAPQRSMTVLVYDLGGGTFDSTLLRLAPGSVKMIATDGDVQLGGYDWDMRVLNHVADAFLQAHGVDPRSDIHATSRLYRDVVEAKHTLSSRTHAKIRLDHAGHHFELELTRQAFEAMTSDLLERTAYTTRQLLAAAKLDWKGVDRIFLVGGSTRMPMVLRMLEQISGIRPDHTVNPDEAVARGAALYAHWLLSKSTPGAKPAPFDVTNVNAHSLGVEGIDTETMRKRNVILIPRNTVLPAKVTQRFATKSEGQGSIVVQVLEGESSLPGECTAIGRTVIRNLPSGLPKGWPVEVTFEYGRNGRLNVRASVSGTKRETVLDLERDVGLSNEGIAHWKQAVAATGGFESFESLLLDSLNLASPDAPVHATDQAAGWALPSSATSAPAAPKAPAGPVPVPQGPAVAMPPPAAPPPAAYPPSPGAIPTVSAQPPGRGVPSEPVARAAQAATASWQPPPAPTYGGPQLPQMPPAAPPMPAPQPTWAEDPAAYAPPYAGPYDPSLYEEEPTFLRRMMNLSGHILAALVGLGVGFVLLRVLLSWVQPEQYPLPSWLHFRF